MLSYMNRLGRKGATEKNRLFFIADMENTRSKLSYVRKSSPVTNLQSALRPEYLRRGAANFVKHLFIFTKNIEDCFVIVLYNMYSLNGCQGRGQI